MDHEIDDTSARDYLDYAFNQLSDGFAIFDADDRLIACNENYRAQCGDHRDIIVAGASFGEIVQAGVDLGLAVHPGMEPDEFVEQRLADFKARNDSEFQTIDGRTIEAREHPLGDGGVACIRIDITKRWRAENALRESEESHRSLIEHQPEFVSRFTPKGKLTFVNTSYANHHGLSRDEMVGMNILDFVPEEERDHVRRYLASLGPDKPFDRIENQVIMPDGTICWQEWSDRALFDDSGRVVELQAFGRDITERRRAEQNLAEVQADLKRLALYDQLTGLANRNLFQDRLHHEIALAKREYRSFWLLILDLDGFKAVNDTFGHAAGDAVLEEVGRRLSKNHRQSDTTARIGGDEFAVLLETGTSREGAELVAQKLVDMISVPYRLNGRQACLGVSIGIAEYPADGADADAIKECADSAMYAAKKAGGGYWPK